MAIEVARHDAFVRKPDDFVTSGRTSLALPTGLTMPIHCAIRDKETGYFTIDGCIDYVTNVSAHRMGAMEIVSALAAHPLVAEVGACIKSTG